jgi:hypothetical protein
LKGDVRDHEIGGAVDQLDDFLEDKVAELEVSDKDVS